MFTNVHWLIYKIFFKFSSSSLMPVFVRVKVDVFNLLFLVVIVLGARLEWPCPRNRI
jgi:hypothetical protein